MFFLIYELIRLDNIEFQNLGGTCHNSNPYLKALLAFIGYKVHLFGADMDEPDVHTSIRGILDSSQYHIDVGYAAPFASPIPLDKTPHEIKHGQYSYLFQKNESLNKYEIKVMSDGQRIHGYSINEIPRQFSFFHKTIYEFFQPGMTFMSCIRITRIFENRTVELKNRTLFHHKNGKSNSVVLNNMREIETAVKNELLFPNCPIKKAIRILESVTKNSFFEDEDYLEEY